MDFLNWEKEYNKGKTNECPYCGEEKPEHSCRECRSDISKEVCWKFKGYCEKDFNFINFEIPKINEQKRVLGVKCKCNDKYCSKCLSINCKDDNCPVHTKELKAKWRAKSK